MFILLAGLLFFAHADAPKGGDACDLAKAELDAFLGAQNRECKTAADCKSYYFRANSCAPAVVLSSKSVTKNFESKLLPFQDKARKACADRWAGKPPCEPIPSHPVCERGQCRERKNGTPVAE
jgi:hypothetical protein